MTEYRYTNDRAQVETRDDGSHTISGYAAKFYREDDPGTEFRLWDGAVERIAPGAFDTGDDVRALFNHNPDIVLGRNTSGTMRLSVDDVGLRYEIDAPANAVAASVIESIQRGDVDGSSFGFRVNTDGAEWRTEGALEVRWLRSVTTYDVGPVTYPAYKSATSQARSDNDLRADHAAHIEAKRQRADYTDYINKRAASA
jgi:hypothetical protein